MSKRKPVSLEYLTSLPEKIPPGRVLVHNNMRPTRRLGSRGFRAWLAAASPTEDDPLFEPCACGWAPELGPHRRVKRPE